MGIVVMLIYAAPVYINFYIAVTIGLSVATISLLIFFFLLPTVILFTMSFIGGVYFLCGLPFLFLYAPFVSVLLPAYAIARFDDTTWGQRSTGSDHTVAEAEQSMKDYTITLNSAIVLLNYILLYFCVEIFLKGPVATFIFLCLIASPSIIQVFWSGVYALVVDPLRPFGGRPKGAYTQEFDSVKSPLAMSPCRSKTKGNVHVIESDLKPNDII